MRSLTKISLFTVVISSYTLIGFCGERIPIKGYFQEDGTYIKQRVIDPIPGQSDKQPTLPDNTKLRRYVLQNHYQGRIFTTKVSFPACHSGFSLHINDLGKTNVELFKKVNKYGVSIEKGSKVIFTKVRIKPKEIDIELDNGGYGSLGDITWRVLSDIFTLGLAELQDYQTIRYQHGSRLRIKFNRKDIYYTLKGNVGAEQFRTALKTDTPAGRILLQVLGMDRYSLTDLTNRKLRKALDQVFSMPDFHQKIDTAALDFSAFKGTERRLQKVQKAIQKGKTIKQKTIRRLNQGLLCASYPDLKWKIWKFRKIRHINKKLTKKDLTFATIEKYLSLVFEDKKQTIAKQ